MRVFKVDEAEGEIRVEPRTLEDLWYLSLIVNPGTLVSGRSFRRQKESAEGDRAKSGEKKPVTVEVRAEQVEFAESANKLRVTGKITWGEPAEFVQVASYHTIDVEAGHPITIKKEISAYDLELLDEAKKSARTIKVAIVAVDERKATVSALTNSGIRHLAEIDSAASKRDLAAFEESRKAFFHELLQMLSTMQFETCIIAGPGFAKDEFAKYVKRKDPAISAKVRVESASTAERSAVSELLTGGALENLLSEQRVAEEFAALEELKKSLAKEDGLAVYGAKEVEAAVAAGAAGKLYVTDELARNDRKIQEVLRTARNTKVRMLIFNSLDEAGAQFKTFGIAAMLRYRTKY
jgi:protein pelota